MTALAGLLASPVARWAALAMALLAAAGTLYSCGRDAGGDKAIIGAAVAEQELRRQGNAAAADAERDGATDRLRDGRF